jgi:hypothetical protein
MICVKDPNLEYLLVRIHSGGMNSRIVDRIGLVCCRQAFILDGGLMDIIADIALPESEPGSPCDSEDLAIETESNDYETYQIVAAYPPEEQNWGFVYESSFYRRAGELSFMADAATNETGTAWAIPEDGRSGLTLSLRGLGLETPDR